MGFAKRSTHPRDCFNQNRDALAGSESERRQLIECVGELQAHEDQGCDHQIEAEMHEGLKSVSSWLCGSQCFEQCSARLGRPKSPHCEKRELPPPRKCCLCREPLLDRRSLFDASSCQFTRRRKSSFPTTRQRWPQPVWPPSVHFPRKRLSYCYSASQPHRWV